MLFDSSPKGVMHVVRENTQLRHRRGFGNPDPEQVAERFVPLRARAGFSERETP